MKNNKDSLEDFFGRRLQEQSFEFDETQWDKLAQRLDEEEDDAGIIPFFSGHGYKAKIIIGIAVISIIAFLLGWHFRGYQPMQRVNDSSHIHISQLDFNTQADKATEEQYKATGDKEDQSLHASKEVIKTNLPKPIEAPSSNSDRKDKGNDGYIPTDGGIGIANNAAQVTKSVIDAVPINDSTTVPAEQTANIRKKTSPTHTKRKPLELIADYQWVRLPIEPLPLLGDSLAKPQAPWSKVAIGVLIAPDFNGTHFSTLLNDFSGAVGATVDYQLSNRFRIGAGLYLNNKRYAAAKGEYKPKAGFWTNGVTPEQIDAQCLVLDIPVEVSFRLRSNQKNALWLHAGVSNYWMLSESYTYQYAYSDPSLVQGWEGKLNTRHSVSTINFSLSYSKRVGENLSLVAAPYFKYYLQGIGHGSVNLLSSGINFGFRYQRSKY